MTETTTPSDAELVERLSHVPVERDTAEHYRGYLRRAGFQSKGML